MRLLFALSLLCATALAQDDPVALGSQAPPESAWLTTRFESHRFVDGDWKGPVFNLDEQVFILVRKGDKARVLGREKVGWVRNDALTSKVPESVIREAIERRSAELGGGALSLPPMELPEPDPVPEEPDVAPEEGSP